MRNRGFGSLPKNDFGAGARCEFAMTADEIRMQMSLNDVFNLEILRPGFLNILIDVALRIDDRRFTI